MTDNITKTYPILEARRRETVSAMFFDGTPECADAILNWICRSHEKEAGLFDKEVKSGTFSFGEIYFRTMLGGLELASAGKDSWIVRSGKVRCSFWPVGKNEFEKMFELITPEAAQ